MKNVTYLKISTILLSIIGIIMIYSASSVWANYKFNNEFYFLIRQLAFFIIGLLLMFFVSKINLKIIYKYINVIFIISIILLILVLIPGIGLVRGGARSWIGIGMISLQPSEFVKLSLIILISKYLSTNYKEVKKVKELIYIGIFLSIIFGLIMLQPDFGTGSIIMLSVFVLLLIAGMNIKYIVAAILMGIISVTILIISAPYRMKRITAFTDPWSDPLGAGFQSIQSLFAISPGGLLGLGLGNSNQKYFYLPEPQTDFIFAIIAEELGLLGIVIILILYFLLFYNCFILAYKQNNLKYKFTIIGITSLILIQFIINIFVVIGLFPVTGVTLPFLSYGGSSLVILLISIGFIINIGEHNYEED